jgi:hypothetical protein
MDAGDCECCGDVSSRHFIHQYAGIRLTTVNSTTLPSGRSPPGSKPHYGDPRPPVQLSPKGHSCPRHGGEAGSSMDSEANSHHFAQEGDLAASTSLGAVPHTTWVLEHRFS